jgi:translation elongation factor EF-Tu-like GTPase
VGHAWTVPTPFADQPVARFVVRKSFEDAGRGTVVAGQIEGGQVRTGDRLSWTRDDVERRATCRGVAAMLLGRPSDPPMLGLFVPEAEPDDFAEGQVIQVFADRVLGNRPAPQSENPGE